MRIYFIISQLHYRDVKFMFLGRVTRARRNMNNKSTPPDTPQRYRETRKRIQSIIDSDSE